MSIISQKFPVFKNKVTGLLILMVSVVVLLQFWWFQESIDLPKLIVWYVMLGVVLLVLSFKKPEALALPTWPTILLLVWFGLLIVGLPFSLDVRNSLYGVFPRYTSSIIFYFSWTFFILVLFVQSKSFFTSLLKTVAGLTVLISAWGIIQYFGVGYYSGITENVRSLVPSFVGNPNFSAMFVVSGIPILFWLATKQVSLVNRYLYGFSIAVSLTSLLFFNSRGAFLAAFLSLVVYFGLVWWKDRSIKKALAMLIVVVFAVTSLLFFYQTRVDVSSKESGDISSNMLSRLILWDYTVDIVKKYPLFGTGLGNFFLAFRENNHPFFSSGGWFDDAHNFVIQKYTMTGVFAGTAFMIIVFTSFFLVFKRYRQELQSGQEVALMTALLAWCVAGSFTPITTPNWILLAILLATILKLFYSKSITVTPGLFSRIAIGVSGIILIITGVMMASSEVLLVKARQAEAEQNYKKSHTYSSYAFRINPFNSEAEIIKITAEVNTDQFDLATLNVANMIAKHPRSSGVYETANYFNWVLYQKTGQEKYKKFLLDYTESMLRYNPNHTFIYRTASLYNFYLKDYPQAMRYVNRSIVLGPDGINSWILRAKIAYELNNKDEVLFSMEKANVLSQQPKVKAAILELKAGKSLKEISFPYNF